LGKIFDALEKSGKESKKNVLPKENDPKDNKKIVLLEKKSRDSFVAGVLKDNRIEKRAAIDKNLICALKPRSFEAEQFKMLRTKLLHPLSGEAPRTIMVTSGLPGEGKSFIAANLAVSIAQNINEHVLLMDCDLRLPSIGKTFGIGNVSGLSEYLADGLSVPDLLCKTMIEKLTVLPAGRPPANPAELLSSEKMFDLLEDVKSRYKDRYIIIDSPPPHLTSEAHVLARRVDGIILVIRQGNSNRKIIAGLVEMLGKKKILGVVFNGVDAQSFGYGGYGKYGKYGRYRYGDKGG
jgi:protein-tyrosine kinase